MKPPASSAMPADSGSDETIFAAALQWDNPAQRAAYLDEACAGNPDLRRRVEELLKASGEAQTFLERPVGQPRRPGPTTAAAPTIRFDVLGASPVEGPGARIGRYKLLQQIGEGGCGTVFMAEQEEPVRRRVALKVIKLGMDTKSVIARFEAERQALAMMDHPNIAKVLDAGTTEQGRPYFVMELVRGIKITDYCDQANLSTKDRLDLFIKVCQAIQHAHQKGIIHRDIKPSNILVTLHDGVPVPKVIDFGIAKATQGELTDKTIHTQFQQFIGTPAYMSPEQAELSGLDIDTRSDIYSLGVLLNELLAGSTPFDAKELIASGIDAMRRTIRDKEPQRPSTRLATLGANQLTTTAKRRSADTAKLLHQLKGDLDWIVMKCLEKDRQRRYDTANGLAADLKRHLDNEPVTARPPSAAYKFQKAFRRNKLVFTAGAIVGVALLLGVGISSWQAIVASRARQQEVKANDRLRAQIQETDQARQAAEKATAAESQQRVRAEELLQSIQFQRAEDLLATGLSVPGLTLLGQMLRANPSNAVVASRFASALLVADRPPLFEPLRHGSNVNYAEFSADGQRAVTASSDKTARVWDARSGQPLTGPLRHEGNVSSAQFSPDGQRVVTASEDKTARVWDARTGLALNQPLRHQDVVMSARFSPDGQRVVTASTDNTARVWDARSGQPLTEPFRHERQVFSADFSPDGQRVVTVSGGTARIWDARSGQAVTEPLNHKSGVSTAQFSPDGQRVVTASWDGSVSVWDALSGQPLIAPLRHQDSVLSAQVSPDGQRVVTASEDNTARVWDIRPSRPLTGLLQHEETLLSAEFSPDGQRVVTASTDNTARVWDARSGQPLTAPLRHEGQVVSARFSPDGQRVVTASLSLTAPAQIWDARSGQPLTEPLRHGNSVLSAWFSPDGQRVVTASTDNTARVWDARSGQPLTEPLRHEDGVASAQFSPDGQRVVTASTDKTARVWDARTGQPLTEPLRHDDRVSSAWFSPDGQRVVTASVDKTARVWDAHSGQPLTEPLRHEGIVISAQFSPDGQRVVTASDDKTARVWEVPVPPVPAPAWFLDWAEAHIGRRFDPKRTAGAVPLAEVRRQQDLAAARTEADFYTRLAHWAQADPSTRTLSPQASLTVPDYIQQRIQENTLASLREAIRTAPTNALAWARLALVEMVQDAQLHPGRWNEAAFSARHALRWDSQNGEAWHAQAAVEQATGQTNQAMISLEKSLQLDPSNRGAWELKGRLLAQTGRPAEALAAYRNPLAALPSEPVAAFQARVNLLQKHLATLAQSGRPQGTEAAQREVVRWLVEEILARGPRPAVPGFWGLLKPLKELADSCREAGFAAEAERLSTRLDEGRRRSAVVQPGNLLPALNISSLDAWLGREVEYAATCASILEYAKDTKDPNLAERTAKICSLLPTDDRTREAALVLARRAVALGKDETRFGLMQLALGMAEYRSGNWRAAEQVLAVAPKSDTSIPNPNVVIPAAFFRAMALFRQGQSSEARQLLTETAAKMTPLPKDPNDPLAGGINDSVLIHWIAYREALALIGSEGSPAQAVKP